METLFLHTTRGTLNPKTLDEARTMHNAFVTAGSQPGIDIARSLGDISHNVYTPAAGVGSLSQASSGELLFLDSWTDPGGMEQFFSNPFAQEAGDRLFWERVEAEWVPAPAAFRFQVPAQADLPARFIALLQASARQASDAIPVVERLVWKHLGAARRRGQLSHQLFMREALVVASRPASNTRRKGGESIAVPKPLMEILAIDWWPTLEGLKEHYSDVLATNGSDDALLRPLTVSVWEQVRGFSEW